MATTWLPVIQYAKEREVQALAQRLELLARMGGEQLTRDHIPAPFTDLGSASLVQKRLDGLPAIANLDQALVLTPAGEVLASTAARSGAEMTLAAILRACPLHLLRVL